MALPEKCCNNCKYYMYDSSTNTSDCNKVDDIPEDLFEKHFIYDMPDCPYHEKCDCVEYYSEIL